MRDCNYYLTDDYIKLVEEKVNIKFIVVSFISLVLSPKLLYWQLYLLFYLSFLVIFSSF